MDFGDDLTLDMLSNNSTASDDIILDPKEALKQDLDNLNSPAPKKEKKEEDKDKITTSEEIDSPESVASEEGEGKTPDATSSSPTGSPKLSDIVSSLASHFHETGVLPSLNLKEAKFESVDDLGVAIQKEIEAGLEENVRQYREAMQRGEPQDAYVSYTNTKGMLDSYTPEVIEKDESAELRFNIIAQDFLNRKFTREEAIKYAKRSQDLGEDIPEAIKALERLKAFNEETYQNHVKAKEAEEQKAVQEIENIINTTDEFVKGVKVPPAVKENLKKQMTTAVDRDENGNPITAYGKALRDNPAKTKTITEYLFMITKGFTDFSKLTGAIESNATRKIDDILKNTPADFLKTGLNPTVDDQTSFGLGDDLIIDV